MLPTPCLAGCEFGPLNSSISTILLFGTLSKVEFIYFLWIWISGFAWKIIRFLFYKPLVNINLNMCLHTLNLIRLNESIIGDKSFLLAQSFQVKWINTIRFLRQKEDNKPRKTLNRQQLAVQSIQILEWIVLPLWFVWSTPTEMRFKIK